MVYVDVLLPWPKTTKWPYKFSCHLFADSIVELHFFAKKIKLKRSWFQETSIPHYDLTSSKRKMAIEFEAKEVERNEAVQIWRKLKDDQSSAKPSQ